MAAFERPYDPCPDCGEHRCICSKGTVVMTLERQFEGAYAVARVVCGLPSFETKQAIDPILKALDATPEQRRKAYTFFLEMEQSCH